MPQKTPVSLKQLAEMAGVSTATVSRVINNNGRFSEETRELVQSLIRKTGYSPNVAAKALRTRTARAIGLVIPDIINEFFSQIVDAMGKFFFDNDYSLFVCNASEDCEKNQKLITNLLGKGIDGLIYISRFPMDFEALDIPAVCLDRVVPGDDAVATVSSDNLEGGRLAAQALIAAGSRKPVLLCAPEDLEAQLSTINDRLRGFSEVMRANGVQWSRKDIILSPMGVAECRTNVARAVREGRQFDGIFSTMDIGAVGTIFGLEDVGLNVPGDVNVVGFDDISFSQYTKPALTTIRQDTVQLANVGAQTLLSIMANPKAGKQHVQIPVSLVVRESTRPFATDGGQP